MKHVEPTELERPRPRGQLRAAAIVLYGTLMLLAVTIPQSVVNWLADMNGNPVQETALWQDQPRPVKPCQSPKRARSRG